MRALAPLQGFFRGTTTHRKRSRHNFAVFLWAVLLGLAMCLPTLAQEDDEDELPAERDPGFRYLLKEVVTTVDGRGLKTTRLRNRIEIQKQHAVDLVGDLSIPYNAFRSEARVVNAFTETADGRRIPLQRGAVRDLLPDEVSSYQMYTDVHQLTFSMPGLAPGAIIEYEIELQDKRPVMPGEFWISEYLDSSALVCTSRVVVTFPARREVSFVGTNLPGDALVLDTRLGSSRTLTWELKNVAPLKYEAGMPPFEALRAQVHLTSVKSWEQVEEWYAAIARKPLQSNRPMRGLAERLVAGITNELERIQALYRYASQEIRYVGVELGRSAYEPHSPEETVQNKYGDCKDKSALLVSLLNAVNIPAHLAIVRPNYDGPVNPHVPGPSQFNHAIVYVPRADGDLWIDPTQSFADVREHGYHLDGIDALVIGKPGSLFVRVPALDETHSVHRLTYDVYVHYGGLTTVKEIEEYSGRAATAERAQRSRSTSEQFQKNVERNLAPSKGYSRLLNCGISDPGSDLEPMRTVVEYESDTFLTKTATGMTISLDAAALSHWIDLPRQDAGLARSSPRVHPYEKRMAHTEEIVCRLRLAEGYKLMRTPSVTRREFPHGKVEMLFENADGAPSLTLRVVSRHARLDPRALPELAQQVDTAVGRARARLDVEDSLNELMRERRYAKAEGILLEAVQRNPNSADSQMRLGLYYKSTGRNFQAQQAFNRVISLVPADPRGYSALSETYSGLWGFPGRGLDRRLMLSVLDRATTNVPVPAWVSHTKGTICLTGEKGGPDLTNWLDEAQAFFGQTLANHSKHFDSLVGLGDVNRLRGDFDTAEDYYRKARELDHDSVAPRAGIWVSLAFAGRDEEAYNAINAYYGSTDGRISEVARVGTLLMLSRKYAEAANLYEGIVGSTERPEVVRRLLRLLRKLEANPSVDYEHFYDDSTPEGVARTIVTATLTGDPKRASRAISPVVNAREVEDAMTKTRMTTERLYQGFDVNYFLDVAFAAGEVTRRTLSNGDVEVVLDGSRAPHTESHAHWVSRFQIRQVDGRWQALTIDSPTVDLGTLGRLALNALDSGNVSEAAEWQARIANMLAQKARTSEPSGFAHIRQIHFTNDALRVKAWGGMALIASATRPSVVRGVASIEDVLSAYPRDVRLKLELARWHLELGNRTKSAGVLSTIDPATMASPDELSTLAFLWLNLGELDAVERVNSRCEEVASDDPRSMALRAAILIERGRFAEAQASLQQLRQSTTSGNRLPVVVELTLIDANPDKAAVLRLIESSRDLGPSISSERETLNRTCVALGLLPEAREQAATLVSEGVLDHRALVCYAFAAVAEGNAAEANDLLSRAEQANSVEDASRQAQSFGVLYLCLEQYAAAARAFSERATRTVSAQSSYSLCFSALAARLAGDEAAGTKFLQEAANLQGDGSWPRLAMDYLRGTLSEEEFRRVPEQTTLIPGRRSSRECEVNTIIGLHKEWKRDIPGALAAYRAAVATKSIRDVEYFVSTCAVRRLAGGKSTSTKETAQR